jgi:hypothetical protein
MARMKTIARLLLASSVLVAGIFGGVAYAQAGDRDCPDFRFQEDAQAFFRNAGAGDPHNLDSDDDGIACETLPHRDTDGPRTPREPREPRSGRTPRTPRTPREPSVSTTARPNVRKAGLPETGSQAGRFGLLGSGLVLTGALFALVAKRERILSMMQGPPTEDRDDHPLSGW